MNRQDRYVIVTGREWAEYNRAPARSVEKRILHAAIFYSGRPLLFTGRDEPYLNNGRIVRDVLHPLPGGRIPDGYAVGESEYVNETKWTVRSERETAHTLSNASERAL